MGRPKKDENDKVAKVSVGLRQNQIARANRVMPEKYQGNFSRFMQDALDSFLDLHEKKRPKKAS